MASLSSKRKSSANRRMQGRDRRVDSAPKAVIGKPELDVFVFDDAVYTSARSRFQAALGSAVTGEQDIAQVMRVLIQQEFDKGGRDAALKMQPYIVKYVGEYRDAQLKSITAVSQ